MTHPRLPFPADGEPDSQDDADDDRFDELEQIETEVDINAILNQDPQADLNQDPEQSEA